MDADGSIYTGQVWWRKRPRAPKPGGTVATVWTCGGAANQATVHSRNVQSQIMNQNVLNFRVVGHESEPEAERGFYRQFRSCGRDGQRPGGIQRGRYTQQPREQPGPASQPAAQLQEQLPWNNGRISGQAVVETSRPSQSKPARRRSNPFSPRGFRGGFRLHPACPAAAAPRNSASLPSVGE